MFACCVCGFVLEYFKFKHSTVQRTMFQQCSKRSMYQQRLSLIFVPTENLKVDVKNECISFVDQRNRILFLCEFRTRKKRKVLKLSTLNKLIFIHRVNGFKVKAGNLLPNNFVFHTVYKRFAAIVCCWQIFLLGDLVMVNDQKLYTSHSLINECFRCLFYFDLKFNFHAKK